MVSITVVYNTAAGLIVEVVRAMYESVLIWNFFVLVSGYIVYDMESKIAPRAKSKLLVDQKIDLEDIYTALQARGELRQMWPVTWLIKPLPILNRTHARKIYSFLRLGINQFGLLNPLLCIAEIIIFALTSNNHMTMKVPIPFSQPKK